MPPHATTPALVVENDPDVVARVHEALNGSGITVAHVARSTRAGVALARRHRRERPDGAGVVLLGTRVVGGPEHAVRELREHPAPVVVLLREDDTDALLADLILAGAAGAVEADALHTLPAVVGAALAGEIALPRRLVGRLLEEYRRRDGHRTGSGAALTARERETLELLRRGMTTREIARHLVVETVTVRSHIASAVRKLRVHDREEALRVLAGSPRACADEAGRRPGDAPSG